MFQHHAGQDRILYMKLIQVATQFIAYVTSCIHAAPAGEHLKYSSYKAFNSVGIIHYLQLLGIISSTFATVF